MRWRGWNSLAVVAMLAVGLSSTSMAQSTTPVLRPEEQTRHELHLKLRSDQQESELARFISGWGSIAERREDGLIRVQLNPNERLAFRATALRSLAIVTDLKVVAPRVPNFGDINSVSRLRASMDEYEAAYKHYERYKKSIGEVDDLFHEEVEGEAGEVDEVPGLDFAEAYAEWVAERAYPFDSFDNTVYFEFAREQTQKTPTFGNSRFAMSQWQFLGPTNLDIPYTIYYGQRPINGRVNAVAYDPNNAGTYYIGAANGGVWKTTDAGVNWMGLSDTWPLMGVSALAVHPTNSNIVLAGTGDFDGFDVAGFGIMRSTDGGGTWTNVGQAQFGSARIRRIVFDPENPNVVIAHSSGTGIMRSTDAGITWSQVHNTSASWSELSYGAMNGGGDRRLYAGGSGVLRRSDDRGLTWNTLTLPGSGGGTIGVAASPVDYDTVYLLRSGNESVYKSTNGGQTWTSITAGFPGGYNWSQSWYDWHIYCSKRDNGSGGFIDVIYIGLIDVVQSPDGGTTWRNIGGGKQGNNWNATYSNTAITHNDQHSFAINPSNPNEVLVGNDGGIYRMNFLVNNPSDQSDDNVAYAKLNRNLGITQFYRIAVHRTNASYVLGGTQDNASPHSFGDLANWGNPGAGDGAGCAINPFNQQNQYASSQGHGLTRTNNAWNSSFSIRPNFSGHSTPFIGIMRLDQNTGNHLYVNTQWLNRYDVQNNTWTMKVGNVQLGNGGIISEIAVADGDSNRIACGANGALHITTDFGVTWREIGRAGQSGGLPNRTVKGISYHPTNRNQMLVTVSGTGTPHVWRCLDTSVANPVWVSVSNGLPNIPTNTIVRDPDDPDNTWYIGTDVGCWMTDTAGASWIDITTPWGLPRTQVSEMVMSPFSRTITAGTFGRGIWQLQLTGGTINSVSVNPDTVYAGDPSTGTVILKVPAGAGGGVVDLSSSDGRVGVPAQITVAEGQTMGTFPITTTFATSAYSSTITATYQGQSKSAVLNVLPITVLVPDSAGEFNATPLFPGEFDRLYDSDNRRYSYFANNPRLPFAGTTIGFTSPTTTADSIKLVVEMNSAPGRVNTTLQAYDHNQRVWVDLMSFSPPQFDYVYETYLPNPNRFIDDDGVIAIRVFQFKLGLLSTLTWQSNIDQTILIVRE
ncbi:MAG: hypothetical protein KF812_05245 [Fimbriimonadaceae bacterium]|nr:hypothetical protein [Fimbriimonadaceae bacterium]